MNHHSGRLIHHQQRLVLEDDADRNVFARDRPFLDFGDVYANDVARLGSVARLFALTADQHVSQRDQGRCLRPRKLGTLGNKEVEADIAVRLDWKLSGVAQRLYLGLSIRHGGGNDGGRRSLLAPENPREQKGPDTDGHVSDVERGPANVSDADVDEIDNPYRRADPVDEVAHRAAADETQGKRSQEITLTRRLEQTPEDDQRASGQRHKNPSGVDPEIQAERRARIVDQRQPDVVAEYLVRYMLRRQIGGSHQLCYQIKRDDEY